MTTDTAVRTTRIVVQDRIELENIPYIDHPEIKVDEHESTQMPFRYVLDKAGKPIFPDVSQNSRSFLSHANITQGMIDLIKKDSERGIDDLL